MRMVKCDRCGKECNAGSEEAELSFCRIAADNITEAWDLCLECTKKVKGFIENREVQEDKEIPEIGLNSKITIKELTDGSFGMSRLTLRWLPAEKVWEVDTVEPWDRAGQPQTRYTQHDSREYNGG